MFVGPTGAGKSYFANQLIGQDIAYPFVSSDKATSETLDVRIENIGIFKLYDTPGLFDNRNLQPG